MKKNLPLLVTLLFMVIYLQVRWVGKHDSSHRAGSVVHNQNRTAKSKLHTTFPGNKMRILSAGNRSCSGMSIRLNADNKDE